MYHCHPIDLSNPCRPTLEVDALTREGDLDAGPLLVTVADYSRMIGPEHTRRCVEELRRKGRIVDHLGVPHVAFPTFTLVEE